MSGFSQISLNQRLQGNNKFLELQTVNEDHFTLNSNAELSLANNLSLSGNLTMGGNLSIAGALSLGTGANISSEEVTATTKLVTDKIEFSDNQAEGLIIEASDGADYIVCKSTNGSEQIQLRKNTFTDGNSVILGTNGSKGILQYANIKNSTIDNTNTITANASSATQLANARLIGGVSFDGTSNIDLPGVTTAGNQNTTGTSASWSSARTTTAKTANAQTLGSVAIQGTGDTDLNLDVLKYDQSNSSAHKLLFQNSVSGHSSNSLQEQLRFENSHMSGMNQSDNLVANWIQQKDLTTLRIYDITASNTFQETKFARDTAGSHPKINGFLQFNTDTSTGGFLSLERDPESGNDTSTEERQLPTGIKLLNKGEFNGSNLGGEMGGIKSNFTSEEFGHTKVYAKYVSGSVQEASLLVKKDLFEMSNASALQFGNADRRITYNNSECAFTGADDLFTFDSKVNIGKGKDDNNPATLGIEHTTNIALGGADQEILGLKYTEGNTPTTHNYSFSGKSGGGISFSRQQYLTNQDAYSGTKTVNEILTMDTTKVGIYKPISNSTAGLTVRPLTDVACLALGNSGVDNKSWFHSVNSDTDYTIQSTGGRNFTLATGTGSMAFSTGTSMTLSTNSSQRLHITSGGDVGIGTTSPGELLHIFASGANSRLKIESPDDNPVINLVAGSKNIYMFNDDSTGTFYIRNTASGTEDIVMNSSGFLGVGTTSPSTRLEVLSQSTNVEINPDMNTDGTFLYGSASRMSDDRVTIVNTNFHFLESADYNENDYDEGAGGDTGIPATRLRSCGHFGSSISIEGGVYLESDRRIKHDIQPIDCSSCLTAINNIPLYKYKYNNYITRSDKPSYGFMAQDVEKVLPAVVNKKDDYLPCIMEYANGISWEQKEDKWELHIPVLMYDLSGNPRDFSVGTQFKFYLTDDYKHIDASKPTTSTLMEGNKFLVEKKTQYCLVVGYKTDDFLTLEKERLFTIYHGCIQELSKKNNEAETKIANLEQKNNEAETKIANVEQRNDNLEKMIIDLTKRVALNENALKTLL